MNCVIPYKILLLWLGGIFLLRVVMQFILQFWQIDFLPMFDLWHSATMPYAALFGIQCLLLALMLYPISHVPPQKARQGLGTFVLGIAWVYLFIMTCRLVIGSFNLSEHSWFNGAVSTAFHFVLGAFLLVYGSAIRGKWQNSLRPPVPVVRLCTYPFILIGCYLLFNWLRNTGSPLMFSAYLSVLIGASGILLHESLAPNREDWRPDQDDIFNDGLFLVLVQIALPAILKGLSLAALVWVAHNNRFTPTFWPNEAPIIVQVFLMLLIAEFFRYWIHRASHKHKLLWKLHAVHHAADKLYTVNVGRFHPLDKTIQFLGDTLPFLLLGVSAEVFAAYFVLYALNGFYQHSNANIALGPLNWIIAGPELHRWHHSAVISEAHANYGNNLIIWDTVFGTRLLPKNTEVSKVGIGNSEWPDGFLPQLSAPFTTPTETTVRKN